VDDDTGEIPAQPLPALPEKRSEEFGRRLGQAFAGVCVFAVCVLILAFVGHLVLKILGVQ
jgi:hypothetical protein